MISHAPETALPAARSTVSRSGALAIAFQEVFTVAIRVRAKRQMAADAESFRTHVKQLLAVADREARQAGYEAEYVKLAVYAYIALLDESVLNSNQPMFASWPRQSLQEEVFGDHIAGENFFVHLQDLMARQDSQDLADILEVFLLCLLLGFRGRYAVQGEAGTVGSQRAGEDPSDPGRYGTAERRLGATVRRGDADHSGPVAAEACGDRRWQLRLLGRALSRLPNPPERQDFGPADPGVAAHRVIDAIHGSPTVNRPTSLHAANG